MSEKAKKCPICNKDTPKGQRLCSAHHKQYFKQRKTDGRTLQQFIDYKTMDVSAELEEENKLRGEITEQNAERKKALYQAKVAQEDFIKKQTENRRRMSELVERSEGLKATSEIISNFKKAYETMLGVIPFECAHKSSGEIDDIVKSLYKPTEEEILNYLKGILDELQTGTS